MVAGIISVGLFWGILLFYTRQSQQQLRFTERLKSILPSKQKCKRYLSRCKKFLLPPKFTKQDALNEKEKLEHLSYQQNSSGAKSSPRKNNSSSQESGIIKTKSINKQKLHRKNKLKEYRLWVSKANDLKKFLEPERNLGDFENLQKSQKKLESQESNKMSSTPILEQISDHSSLSSIKNKSRMNNYQTDKNLKYNPFCVNELTEQF